MDLSPIPGVKVDKHSTGGVGDKTSLILGPIAAACGVKIAKMRRPVAWGTPGAPWTSWKASQGCAPIFPREEFFSIVRQVGLSIIGQSGNPVPGG